MSRSINIIKHLVDENLIDAKEETESYLNDVLSDVLKHNYKRIAPSMVGEGAVTTSDAPTTPRGAVSPSGAKPSQDAAFSAVAPPSIAGRIEDQEGPEPPGDYAEADAMLARMTDCIANSNCGPEDLELIQSEKYWNALSEIGNMGGYGIQQILRNWGPDN